MAAAIMTPGRSLPPKTSGRSSAPVASIASRARRSATAARADVAGPGRATCFCTRSTAPKTLSSYQPKTVVRVSTRTFGSAASSASDAVRERRSGLAADPSRFDEQRAAEPRAFVDEDHAGAGPPAATAPPPGRRPGADHQQVAMRPGLLVAVRVGLVARPAEAGGPADEAARRPSPRSSSAT